MLIGISDSEKHFAARAANALIHGRDILSDQSTFCIFFHVSIINLIIIVTLSGTHCSLGTFLHYFNYSGLTVWQAEKRN